MAMTSITIAPATPADVPSIRALIAELAEYEKLSDRMTAKADALRDGLFGTRPYAEALIGRLGGETVGYALFFHTYSTFMARPGIYLEDVYVTPAARGKGVGKALLREVARVARGRDCGRIEWSVLNWNKPSIDFYVSLGADPMDEWTMYRLDVAGIAALAR